MGCQACTRSVIWQKLGRCRRCIRQLAVLSPLGWGIWLAFYRHQPTTIEAVTAFVAASGTTLLLLAHGMRAWRLGVKATRATSGDKKSPTSLPGK
ncbi:hypothetical protein RJ45_24440 [Photobacterium gaetbulicola]|uniref:DUF3624 domain-containing protein n=1 Tax=Photobacterium gaetbulicola TaxID=1295392 RepID=A0A0B9FS59_9GAMM|nr:DUF3624 domain-containing protein [Photobacterium gaetbulicola]KHT59353.1 hypothetical protein RJ45_24440 [Photobacterium gaetbulicola]